MSVITDLQAALEVDAAVLWSLMALAIALIAIGLCGCMYCCLVVPIDKYKTLDGVAEERMPLVNKAPEERACAPLPHRAGGTTEGTSGSIAVVVEKDVSGSADTGSMRGRTSPTKGGTAGPTVPALLSSFTSSGSFGGSTGGSGSFSDTWAGNSGGLGRAPVALALCDVSEEAQVIIGEWAQGVEVTLFSHARLPPSAAPKDSGKASSRPRRIKLFLEGDRLVWRKDRLFGSRVCGIPVAEIVEVTPGRSAFKGPFCQLRCHEFPAKGDERYLTIRASTDAIELECGSKGERDALLGGLRIICESMVKDGAV